MSSTLAILHPAVVHFPIACFILSAVFDVLAIFLEHHLDRSAFWLLLVGVGAAGIAVITGNQAASAVTVAPLVAVKIEAHEEAALFTLWFGVGLLAIRATVTFMRMWERRSVRQAYLFLTLFLAGATAVTGYRGGKLVFEHGVGVKPLSEPQKNR